MRIACATSACLLVTFVLGLGSAHGQAGGGGTGVDPAKAALGKTLFTDTSLSQPTGQSCSSCHGAKAGFADPSHVSPVSMGAVTGRVGARNAPTAAYAAFSPAFHYDATTGLYTGGQFWDGRAATLADQAKGPLLNPLEHNMANAAAVVAAVQNNTVTQNMMTSVYGAAVFNDTAMAFNDIADAIATYETSSEVNPFTSKYDKYLAGQATLSDTELRGLLTFTSHCGSCHTTDPVNGKQMFTNYTYHNVGMPANPNNPFYKLSPDLNPAGAGWVDLGLGGVLGLASENGKFKVPTMRNVAVTGPYGHDGYFQTLPEMVRFAANRDLEPWLWGGPEVTQNVDPSTGDMGFSPQDVTDVTAFLNTLTDDGMVVPEPATIGLMLAGAGMMLARRRRRAAAGG